MPICRPSCKISQTPTLNDGRSTGTRPDTAISTKDASSHFPWKPKTISTKYFGTSNGTHYGPIWSNERKIGSGPVLEDRGAKMPPFRFSLLGHCRVPATGSNSSISRRRRPSWRRCDTASTVGHPTEPKTGLRGRPSNWDSNPLLGREDAPKIPRSPVRVVLFCASFFPFLYLVAGTFCLPPTPKS